MIIKITKEKEIIELSSELVKDMNYPQFLDFVEKEKKITISEIRNSPDFHRFKNAGLSGFEEVYIKLLADIK